MVAVSFDAAFWLPRSPVDPEIVLGDGTPCTTSVCLKGRLREFGASLQLPAAAGVVYVGRRMSMGGWRLAASDWANPFRAQKVGGAARAVELYAKWLPEQAELLRRLPELRGRRLACWCPADVVCHARHLAGLVDRLTVASR